MKLFFAVLLVTLSIVTAERGGDRDQERGNGRKNGNRGNNGGGNNGNGGGNNGNGGGNNGAFWNPFHDNFNMANIRGAPEGFGTFPSFGSGFGNTGFGNTGFGNTGFGNSGFGNTGSGGNSDNRDRGNDRGNDRPRNANNNKNNNNRNNNNNGFAPNTFSWGAPTFVDFGSTFENFRNQFGSGFGGNGGFGNGGFGNFGGGFGGVVPVVVPAGGGVAPVAPVDENEGESDSPTMAPNVATVSSSTSTTLSSTVQTVSTSTFASNSPIQSMTVTNRNCTQEGLVIGLTQNSNDDCGSVECECFHGIYFCYSTCAPPPANQTCDAVVPSGSNCPTYTNCGPIANVTVGLAEVFRCDTRNNAVHPAICWMYEILYGKLTEPLGYFESVAEPACSVSTQCFCGANGFVQPALLKQEDFKTPANNQVFQRAQGGRKGAFASN